MFLRVFFLALFLCFHRTQSQLIPLGHYADPANIPTSPNVFDEVPLNHQATTVTSSGPDVARAKQLVYLTGSAYCLDVADWKCDYCAKAAALGYTYSSTFVNASTKTFGFIAVNSAAKEIVVAFRGTYNVHNVFHDFSTKKDGFGPGHGDVGVHDGFLEATNSLYSQVVEQLGTLLAKDSDNTVVLTGSIS